ncbi:MAG: hypothetical protein ACOYOD_03355 [Saprospiraceae bacterium]
MNQSLSKAVRYLAVPIGAWALSCLPLQLPAGPWWYPHPGLEAVRWAYALAPNGGHSAPRPAKAAPGSTRKNTAPNKKAGTVRSFFAADCTASFGIDRASLHDYFGLDVLDNCSEVNLDVQIESCVPKVVSKFVLEEENWRYTSYPTMRVKERLMVSGVPIGKHRLIVAATDVCGNKMLDTLHFVVIDRSAPTMKCRDEFTIALSNSFSKPYGEPFPRQGYPFSGYAKVKASEIDAGSQDNCGMDWVRVRRAYRPSDEPTYVALGYDWNRDGKITLDGKDGVDWNSDGDIGDDLETFEPSRGDSSVWMTPALDYVEFFCSDRGPDGVMVELWGKDKTTLVSSSCAMPTRGGLVYPSLSGGNLNHCWMKVVVEDNIEPSFATPSTGAFVFCDNRELYDSLSTPQFVPLESPLYAFIENRILEPQGKGRFYVTKGNDCEDVEVNVGILPYVECGSGYVELQYFARKRIKGEWVEYFAGYTEIDVRPFHSYNIRFPADTTYSSCQGLLDTTNVADGQELGCDILSTYVSDKRYDKATRNGQPAAGCFVVLRTFFVVDWCQFDYYSCDTFPYAIIVPRDPDRDGNNGVNVLVRDSDRDSYEEIYYEDAAGPNFTERNGKNFSPSPGEQVVSPGFHEQTARLLQFNNEDFEPWGSPCYSYPYRQGFNETEYFAWMFTQQITVADKQAPVVEPSSEPLVFYQDKKTCTAEVHIPIVATDECAALELEQDSLSTVGNIALERVRLKLEGQNERELGDLARLLPGHALDGDEKGDGRWVLHSTAMPIGNHSLIVIARDDCGNLSAQREIPFSVRDTTPPVPVCYTGLAMQLSKKANANTGEVVLWASDLVAGPTEDCNGQGPARGPNQKPLITKYYVVKDNGDRVWDEKDSIDRQGFPLRKASSVTLTCEDAAFTQVLIRLYAEDEKGNMGYCETYVLLSDPLETCPKKGASAIAGIIATERGNMVDHVEVQLDGGASMMYRTDQTGKFAFKGLNDGMDYSVTPYRNDDVMNGVSTYDLLLLTRHILGTESLDSPYQLIAADVNHSGAVSTSDIVALRRVILGLDAAFPNNTSWRFVDAAFTFHNPQNPWATPMPETIKCPDLHENMSIEFIGIKIGDLNGDASSTASPRSTRTVGITSPDVGVRAGETYPVSFYADLSAVEALQFTLYFPSFDWVGVEPGTFAESEIAVFEADKTLTVSWSPSEKEKQSPPRRLFTLLLKAGSEGELKNMLHLSSRITPAAAFYAQGTAGNVSLYFSKPEEVPSENSFELLQNEPNPFSGETLLRFRMPEAGEATLTVQDVSGRILWQQEAKYPEGMHTIRVTDAQLRKGATGAAVLYYTLTTGRYTATRKMIVLNK